MLINITVDPTELTEGAGVTLLIEKDLAEYVTAFDLLMALDRFGETIKRKAAAKWKSKYPDGIPPFSEKVYKEMSEINMKQLMEGGPDTIEIKVH